MSAVLSTEEKTKRQIEEFERLEVVEFKFTNPYDYFGLPFDHLRNLLPITKEAAHYALEKTPRAVSYLLATGRVCNLCVDKDSFQKVTFLIAQTDRSELQYEMTCLRTFLKGLELCPDEAMKRMSLFEDSFQWKELISLLVTVPVPQDAKFIQRLLMAARELGRHDIEAINKYKVLLPPVHSILPENIELYKKILNDLPS